MNKPIPFADCHLHIRGNDYARTVGMFDTMVSQGVTDCAVLALPYHSVAENLFALYCKKNYTKMTVRAFGSPHDFGVYGEMPFEKQVEGLLDMGCDGIKFMEMNPSFRKVRGHGLNAPRYDAMFSLLEERQAPVLMHVNDPEEFWQAGTAREQKYTADYPSKQLIYDETFEMLDKHPKLRVTFAHFFFLSNELDEAKRVMEKYPNVRFDLTPGWEMFLGFSKNVDGWHDFFTTYADRILFGTDSGPRKNFNDKIHDLVWEALTRDDEFIMPCYGKCPMHGLGLDETTVKKICSDNYFAYMNPLVPLNEDLIHRAAERVLADYDPENPLCDDVYPVFGKLFPKLLWAVPADKWIQSVLEDNTL